MNHNPDDPIGKSPIETVHFTQVFQLNMRESLLAYEKHYQELQEKHNKQIKLASNDPQKLQTLETSFNNAVDLLVESYDTYMKQLAPSPHTLPLRISLKIPTRNVHLELNLPQTTTFIDLRKMISDFFVGIANPIEAFVAGGQFIIYFSIAEGEDTCIVEDETLPIGRFNITPGSSIFYTGELILRGDAPKVCFTRDFEKGKGMRTNYYSCPICKMNWICENCAQTCHADHGTKLAIPNHEPTWPCCYCVKNNVCTIPNNKRR